MGDDELTKEEKKAVRNLSKALKAMPPSLIIYVVDDWAVVCKKGVPSEYISEPVGGGLSPTNMLTDAHDDCMYGEGDFQYCGWHRDHCWDEGAYDE